MYIRECTDTHSHTHSCMHKHTHSPTHAHMHKHTHTVWSYYGEDRDYKCWGQEEGWMMRIGGRRMYKTTINK